MVLDRLSADDRLMLWPDAVWPQDVGALVLLDGAKLFGPDGSFLIRTVRKAIEARLHLVPRFRQVLLEPSRGLGGPLWVDAPAFDIRDHVNVVAVPPPGGEPQLLALVETLRRRRLDRARPLWELWFLTGLTEGRTGLLVRWHHVVADGMAGTAALGSLLDDAPGVAVGEPQPWTPAATPSRRRLLADDLRRRVVGVARSAAKVAHPLEQVRRVRQGLPALRELVAAEPGPVTSLGRLIGTGRQLALVRGDLADATAIAHEHDTTVNDVLLAVTAGGVRQLLKSRGEEVEDLSLPVYVPVSLRRDQHADGARGNLISQMVVPLPIGEPDPGRRLGLIGAESATRKELQRAPLGGVFRSKLVAGVALKLVARQRVNLVTADLAGPPVHLYLAGAQVLEVFPIVNLVGTVSLGVGAVSYAGAFDIAIVADADAYPDLDEFTAGVRADLDDLVARSSTLPLRA